ncbi:MAG TPA: hypothetical protein VFN78_08455 [Ktedonobacterales bacterium]|nr:hypothetical protein [Ktedonobacterales bacterium]
MVDLAAVGFGMDARAVAGTATAAFDIADVAAAGADFAFLDFASTTFGLTG